MKLVIDIERALIVWALVIGANLAPMTARAHGNTDGGGGVGYQCSGHVYLADTYAFLHGRADQNSGAAYNSSKPDELARTLLHRMSDFMNRGDADFANIPANSIVVQQDYNLPSVCFRGRSYKSYRMNQGISVYENEVALPVGLVKNSDLETTSSVAGETCPMPEMKVDPPANQDTLPSFQLSLEDRLKIDPVVPFVFSGPLPLFKNAKVGSCFLTTKELLSPTARVSASVSSSCSYEDRVLSRTITLNAGETIELVIRLKRIKGMGGSTDSDLLYFYVDAPISIAKGASNADGSGFDTARTSNGEQTIDGSQLASSLGGSLLTGVTHFERGSHGYVLTGFSTKDPTKVFCFMSRDEAHLCVSAADGVTILRRHNSYMDFDGSVEVYVAGPYAQWEGWFLARNTMRFIVKDSQIQVLAKSDMEKRRSLQMQSYWQWDHDRKSWFFYDICGSSPNPVKYQYADILNKHPLYLRDATSVISEFGHTLKKGDQDWVSFSIPSFDIPIVLKAGQSIKDILSSAKPIKAPLTICGEKPFITDVKARVPTYEEFSQAAGGLPAGRRQRSFYWTQSPARNMEGYVYGIKIFALDFSNRSENETDNHSEDCYVCPVGTRCFRFEV